MSIVVFTVQQGNADVMIMYKNCAVPNMSIQEKLIKRSISCVHSQKVYAKCDPCSFELI